MIVLHYTGMQFCHEAIHRLCDPKARVSSHYVVLESGSIIQLVPESQRAWHAGVSAWAGDTDINSRSIGIEIGNPGHDFGYPDFPARQIAATITLCRGILTRNIIRPENVVAHSDVAPSRKQDPGEKFPWKLLAQSGVGLWVDVGAGLRAGAGEARRQWREGHRAAEDAGRVRLRHRRHRPLRHRAPPRSSPPSSATSARRRSTASPTLRRCRHCGSSWSPAIPNRRSPIRSLPPHPKEYGPPLDGGARRTPSLARQSAGRPLRQSPKGGRGGKSGLHGQTVPDNVRRGQPQGQCHREQTAAARCVLPRQG